MGFDSAHVILVDYLVMKVVIDCFVIVAWVQLQKQVGILMPNQDPLQQQQWVVVTVEQVEGHFDM